MPAPAVIAHCPPPRRPQGVASPAGSPATARRARLVSALVVFVALLPWRPAHADAPTGKAPTVAWRPLRAPCLPAPGPVYASRWPALQRLKGNAPVEVRGEAEFASLLGCASGVDWRRERLVLLLLQVGNMDAVRLEQAADSGTSLALRVRITRGAGYDDGSRGLAGSHVFFGILVPASASALGVEYRYANVRTARYSSVMRDCARVPRSRR